MKRIVFTLVILFSFCHLYSQTQTAKLAKDINVEWGTYWNGGKNIYPTHWLPLHDTLVQSQTFSLNASAIDSMGNLYIVGKGEISRFPFNTQDTNYIISNCPTPNYDAFIAKFNKEGALQWAHYYGSSRYDEATAIKINSKNEIYVSGWILQNLYPAHDNGTKAPSNLFSFWKNDFPTFSPKGGLNRDTGSLFLLKFDTEGKRLWAGLYGPQQINTDSIFVLTHPLNMEIDNKDQVYLTGSFLSLGSIVHPWVKDYKKLSVFGEKNAFQFTPSYDYSHYENSIYPSQFLLKLNAQDSLVWSTYLPLSLNLMACRSDSKQNLFLYGGSAASNMEELAPLEKPGAYFSKRSSVENAAVFNSFPILAQLDSTGIFRWCTHIGKDQTVSDKNQIYQFDLLVTEKDHLIITGGTSSNTYPLIKFKNGFFQDSIQNTTSPYNYDSTRIYLSEFDQNGKMIWSTFYSYKNFKCIGAKLVSDLHGGFYLLSSLLDANIQTEKILGEKTSLLLSHFNRNRQLIQEQEIPSSINFYALPAFLDGNSILVSSNLNQIEGFNTVALHTLPNLHIELDSRGKLYVSGNALSLDPSLLVHANKNAYFQDQPLLSKDPLSGFILAFDLCDTTTYPPISLGIKDTLICKDAQINIPLHISESNYLSRRIVWNAATDNEFEGDEYTITKTGTYFVEVRTLYSACPSVIYSDTIHVDTLPKPILNFPKDTVKRCIGEGIYKIHATNPQSSYLWSDGSTDSIYLLRYKDSSIVNLNCTVTNICGLSTTDSLVVQFLPPYAYLGKDTILCKTDSLLLDMNKLNMSIPKPLHYIWLLNNDTVQGCGENQGSYLIRSKDSGTLIVEVHWPQSQCEVAKDTLNFSYYLYPNVNPIVNDTTICANSEIIFDANRDTFGPDASVQWYNASQALLSTSDTILLSEIGTYTLRMQNYCSKASATFTLSHYPLEWTELRIPADTVMCQTVSIVLDVRIPNHPTTYTWEDAPNETSGVRVFSEAGEYGLTLTDSIGCFQSHTINLRSEDCNPVLEVPNVFTPNGDGINDLFKVKTQEKIFNFTIQIFNSFGLIVHKYQGNPADWQWDGSNNLNQQVPDGTYFWIAQFKDFKGKKKKETGCVMILR